MHSGIDKNHLSHLERVDGVGLAGVGNPCCGKYPRGRVASARVTAAEPGRLVYFTRSSPNCFTAPLTPSTHCSTDEDAARTVNYLLPFTFLRSAFKALRSFLADTTVLS